MKTTRRGLFGAVAGLLGLAALPKKTEKETFQAAHEMWERLEFDPLPKEARWYSIPDHLNDYDVGYYNQQERFVVDSTDEHGFSGHWEST